MILTGPSDLVIPSRIVDFDVPLTSYRDERPVILHRLRIYERVQDREVVQAIRDADEHVADVLRDSAMLKQQREVEAIIKDTGVVGWWRPSTIIVQEFMSWGAHRILVERALAHALWDQDLLPVQFWVMRGESFRLILGNDMPVDRHLRVHIQLRAPTDAEYRDAFGVEALRRRHDR